MALHKLPLSHYAAQTVLMPGAKQGEFVEAVRVTVYGERFPQRAMLPELIVGDARAERVTIAPDERSIRGYLRARPPDGARIAVRYGASQEGTLERPFHPREIRPLPEGCGGGSAGGASGGESDADGR
jgi:hypothetical protein